MKKAKRKKLVNWCRKFEARRAGTAKLAAKDTSGRVEKKIRSVWRWAAKQIPSQDPSDRATVGALQDMMSSQRDTLNQYGKATGRDVDPFPTEVPAIPTPKPEAAPPAGTPPRGGLSAHDLHVLRTNPKIRRAFQLHQRDLAAGIATLSDDQRRLAEKLQLDRNALREVVVKLAANPSSPPAPRDPVSLTPEQRRIAKRLGIDPKVLETQMEAGPPSEGVEIHFPKSASAI
jgi:hypothetical protein